MGAFAGGMLTGLTRKRGSFQDKVLSLFSGSFVAYYPMTETSGTAAGGLSAAVDLSFMTPVAIIGSTDWDTANLTFQCSYDGVTYGNMYDDAGTEYTVTVPTTDGGDWLSLDPADFAGINYIKLRSGTSGTHVQQTNASTLSLITRRVG